MSQQDVQHDPTSSDRTKKCMPESFICPAVVRTPGALSVVNQGAHPARMRKPMHSNNRG
jgi:hypothetical protein